MRRGQAAIEFMFILLIVILFIFTSTRPAIDSTQLVTEDVTNLVRTNNEAQRIANAVTDVYMLGERSKKTIEVFVPTGGEIHCNDGATDQGLWFEVELKAQPFLEKNWTGSACKADEKFNCCGGGKCIKEVLTSDEFGGAGFPVDCDDSSPTLLLASGKHTITVTKNSAGQVEIREA